MKENQKNLAVYVKPSAKSLKKLREKLKGKGITALANDAAISTEMVRQILKGEADDNYSIIEKGLKMVENGAQHAKELEHRINNLK